uniref:Glutathione S-transferase n=1 Tax=Rhodopseudomonas palustris (strain BisA53) TaxID=316055 RepID=Q07TV1_RHOP5
MKLYYSPGACSLSPHIALCESGLPFELVKVDIRAKKLEDGSDYLAVNPKGSVPALALDDGGVLTEGPAIVQLIADKEGSGKLAPANGTAERYRLQEWLNFVSTDLHKSFGPLFSPALGDDAKQFFRDRINKYLGYADKQLEGKDYLMGASFSVADGYLFVILTWCDRMKIDLAPYPNLAAFKARVAARPKVQQAMASEGLLQKA